MGPESDGSGRNPERGLVRAADAGTAGGGVLPGEERQDGAGPAGLVPEVQVVGAGVVEVDGLLDEPEAEGARVEREVPARGTGDGSDVVDACGHGRPPVGSGGAACQMGARGPKVSAATSCLRARKHCASRNPQPRALSSA